MLNNRGAVRAVLRLEGLCVLVCASLLFAHSGFGGWTYALMFFVPDLSLMGYFFGPRVGAVSYNMAHSYVGALACLATGLLIAHPTTTSLGLIWCAHIGFDRALGYGLKYATGFKHTHMGNIGSGA